MNDEQITAVAREYAEEEYKTLNLPTDHTEVSAYRYMDFARFLLRRYCLVEKSKLKTKHKEALAALESNDNEDVKWGTYRLSLLKSLFPEIGKEVEE